MVNVGEVMFWKALILSGWAAFQEARERGKFNALVIRFQHEWDRRRAKQPLALVDRSSERLE